VDLSRTGPRKGIDEIDRFRSFVVGDPILAELDDLLQGFSIFLRGV
jgi:hypothetical protein